jgi:hypothetical protein
MILSDRTGDIVRDEDAVTPIAHSRDGVEPGYCFSRDDEVVKQHPTWFVPVTRGVKREDALVALSAMTHTDSSGETRAVHKGQWVEKTDPLVALNPLMFEQIEPANEGT